MEGNEEKRTAKLVTADGYSMYVFDGFTFAAPISMLTMDIDPIYYARIEKLPAGYKLDEIEKEAETELAKVGKVQEAAGAGISPLLAALHS